MSEKEKDQATPGPMIFKKVLDIQEDIPAILKDKEFKGAGGQTQYHCRGIDDLYNALNPHFRKHRVFMVPSILEHESTQVTNANGKILFYEKLVMKYALTAEDGSKVEATVKGIGMDLGDKAANKAMSVAQKYALIQMFSIPTTDVKDPENDGHQVAEPAIDINELNGKLANCTTPDEVKDLYNLLGGDSKMIQVRPLFLERGRALKDG
jgi:hypothetical protein